MKLNIHPDVADALKSPSAPVVALESTLLAHGLPAPIRLDVAHELEALVRDHQAVPATIAIIDNELCIGLNAEQLKRLTQENTKKASVRDLAVALTTGGVWATTVASTMYIASLASIRLFATGGIGGVHRKAAQTFDESADLLALAKYPVAVVSAGAKAILDLPKTVERLETLGVPILGYNTDSFPGFYCPSQDLLLKHRFTETATIAQVVHNRIDTLGQGGVLIVQDPPREAAQEPMHVEAKIRAALEKADSKGINGAETTPFLLQQLADDSNGSFVDTNLALVRHNVVLASAIARDFARIT